jgi:hypothetical protein
MVTLSLLDLDTGRTAWDQRQDLACPDAEGLLTLAPGATDTIRGLLVSPRDLPKGLSRHRYQAVARLATVHYEPRMISAGEIELR